LKVLREPARKIFPVHVHLKSSRLSIRGAVVGDAAAIAKVHVDSWRTTYAGILPDDRLAKLSYSQHERIWRKNLAKHEFIYVAEEEGGQVVGFVAGGQERGGDPVYRGEIYALYLLQNFQRRGLGRRLNSAAARKLLETGYESMLVWVLAENPARGFYQALGGELVSEKPIEVGDAKLIEAAYGWKDLRLLLSAEM
jgi:L-amino acid N-acyltransferase YncA